MARLGSKGHPAVIRTQTEERAQLLFETCTARGWDVIVGVEPDMPEDITDMLKLENPDAFTARRPNLRSRSPRVRRLYAVSRRSWSVVSSNCSLSRLEQNSSVYLEDPSRNRHE